MTNHPEDWRPTLLSTVAKKVRRPIAVEPETLYRQIGVRSFGKGIFHKEPVTGADLGGKGVFWVRPGDFVLNIVFAWEGAVALVSGAEEGMCASHRFPTFKIDEAICDPAYLLLHFKTKKGVEQLALASPGGAGRNRTLNQTDFLNLVVTLPSLSEQRKIVNIINTWDQAVYAATQLVAALQGRKQGLMQRLLTGQIRLPEYEGRQWKNVRLGDVLNIQYGKSPLGIRNKNGRYVIWGTGGPVGRTDDVLCDRPAVIIGRKGTIDKPELVMQPFWAIDTTFYCTVRDELDISWIYQFLSFANLAQYNEASGVPSLSRNTLEAIDLLVPNVEEQRKTAALLEICDGSIRTAQRYVEVLQQQKLGLMQRLLSGQVRVCVDEDEGQV